MITKKFNCNEIACTFLLYEECKGKCVKHRILWSMCAVDKVW